MCRNAERNRVFGRKRKIENNIQKQSLKEVRRAFVCTISGTRELQVENYGSLGDYSDKKIVLHCYKSKMIIEGEGLLIEYFTDIDMRITGRIHTIHF